MNVLNAGYIKCFGILFVEVEKMFNATASVASLLMGVNAAAYSITGKQVVFSQTYLLFNASHPRVWITTFTFTK